MQIWEVEGCVLECLHDENGSEVMRSGSQTSDSELVTGELPLLLRQPTQIGGRSPAEEEEEALRWPLPREPYTHFVDQGGGSHELLQEAESDGVRCLS